MAKLLTTHQFIPVVIIPSRILSLILKSKTCLKNRSVQIRQRIMCSAKFLAKFRLDKGKNLVNLVKQWVC
jgi:hypothetical protein